MHDSERSRKAVDFFNSGYNCAQSVILSFAEEINADEKTAVNIASGFGGGMGKLQKTCGALTGSFMVISLVNSSEIKDKSERKERTNHLIQRLEEDFTSRYGYSDCSLLTRVNLNTPQGQEEFSTYGINCKVCERSIAACISWLEKNLLMEK